MPAALDDAVARKAIELAGDCLAVRTNAARDLGVGGRWKYAGGLAFSGRQFGQAQSPQSVQHVLTGYSLSHMAWQHCVSGLKGRA